jgi:hypothetical protein
MEKKVKTGFSWMGFLCGPHYYAGYGNLKKGIILALLCFMPLTALGVSIHCGLKANAELPVGRGEFNWKNVAITVALIVVMVIIEEGIFGLYSRGL